MRLETIKLKGLLRFRDEVSVDLRDLPPGLIAVVGPNGSGKTTIMESPYAALYRAFPTREGELFDYTHDRDAFLEATYAVDGDGVYRARVNIDGVSRGSDAILARLGPDGSEWLLNDGRVTTFDAAVRKRFPPPPLVLASVFAAQNRAGSFVDIDKKARKELFASLIGLDHYEAMSATAKAMANEVDAKRTKYAVLVERLDQETAAAVREALTARVNELQASVAEAELAREELRQAIADHEAALPGLQERAAAYEFAVEESARLERQLADAEASKQAALKQSQSLTASLRAELDRIEAESRDAIAKVDAKIERNKGLQPQEAAIRDSVSQVADLTAVIDRLTAEIDHAAALKIGIDENIRQVESLLHAVALDESKLSVAERAAATINTVPCHGQHEYAGCRFLTGAVDARGQIAALKESVARRPALEAEKATLRTAAAERASAMASGTKLLQDARRNRSELEATAAMLAPLEAATARIAELTEKREEFSAACTRLIAESRQRAKQQREELDRQYQTFGDTVVALAQQLSQARRTVAATAEAHDRLTDLSTRLAAARKQWDENTSTLAVLRAQTDEVKARVAEVREKMLEKAVLQARMAALDAEGAEWRLLSRALGKDGLPVLEIDAAGPTVSAYLNDLLSACFGPRFTCELITQAPKVTTGKDGSTHKEVFAIRVFDNEDAGEVRNDISDLSGGEQVIVDEALKAALAIYANARNEGMPLRTCWRDETTGPLRLDNALRYVAMLRRMQALAGFHHVIFVTHSTEAAALADVQLHVNDGAVSIVHPPYTEAA